MLGWISLVATVLGTVTAEYSDEIEQALVNLFVTNPKAGIALVGAYGVLTTLLNSPISKAVKEGKVVDITKTIKLLVLIPMALMLTACGGDKLTALMKLKDCHAEIKTEEDVTHATHLLPVQMGDRLVNARCARETVKDAVKSE